MKFACPRCPDEIDLRVGACPSCGFSLTVGEVLLHYWGCLRGRVQREAVIQCPTCGEPIPLTANACPNPKCGTPLTVGSTVDAVLEPPRRQWRGFLANATPATARRVQWIYLVLSAAILSCLLAYVVDRNSEGWGGHVMLSILYLGVFSILVLVLVPRQFLHTLATRASWQVKLALACNSLTFLLLCQIIIGGWWARVLTLAGLFAATYLAIWVLPAVFFSAKSEDQKNRWFDPSAPQGRRGRFD